MIFFTFFYLFPGTFRSNPKSARLHKAKTTLQIFQEAIEIYKKSQGKYPTTEEGLQSLTESVGELEFIIKRIPSDPWGSYYHYSNPPLIHQSEEYDLYSYGINGIDEQGQGDDIVLWEKEYGCKAYGQYCLPYIIAVFVVFGMFLFGFFVMIGWLKKRLNKRKEQVINTG